MKYAGEEHLIDSGEIKILREIIRRAVQTIRSYRDNEARYLALGRSYAGVNDIADMAYGYNEMAVRYQPTAQEIDQSFEVWDWLRWLKEAHGNLEFRRLTAWAAGVSAFLLAQREKCSEKTIMNRIDRSVARIANHFRGTSFKIEVVTEPYKRTDFAFVTERPIATGKPVRIGKVFVYEHGIMLNGKRWDDNRRRHGV